METQILYPPYLLDGDFVEKSSVFLAGTIDMGNSVDWQAWAAEQLRGHVDFVFNPRRPDWDASWAHDSLEMTRQINWELDHLLDYADVKAFYFAKASMSPISFLELGLCLRKNAGQTIVYCPQGFYRKSNVDVTCSRFGVKVYENETEWMEALIEKIKWEIIDKDARI